ncbi:hypothetical protein RF11_12352 [Thelohanellus kitauei]|uniref:Uncharacterized protein n=1 Tax=Thelohanellus kitauei TaxID=669202 RepID=A0A0C2N970_THEKT|nr:hypothetical protein RF11_12352 [Thelohanellus kitauei]
MEWGYKYQSEIGDEKSRDSLYQRADELRLLHNISHTCIMTTFDANKYNGNLHKAHEDKEKFIPKQKNARGEFVTSPALCRHCVDAFEKLSEYILNHSCRWVPRVSAPYPYIYSNQMNFS